MGERRNGHDRVGQVVVPRGETEAAAEPAADRAGTAASGPPGGRGRAVAGASEPETAPRSRVSADASCVCPLTVSCRNCGKERAQSLQVDAKQRNQA